MRYDDMGELGGACIDELVPLIASADADESINMRTNATTPATAREVDPLHFMNSVATGRVCGSNLVTNSGLYLATDQIRARSGYGALRDHFSCSWCTSPMRVLWVVGSLCQVLAALERGETHV